MNKLICCFLFKVVSSELTGILKLADNVLERVKKSAILNLTDNTLLHNATLVADNAPNTNLISLPNFVARSQQFQNVSLLVC